VETKRRRPKQKRNWSLGTSNRQPQLKQQPLPLQQHLQVVQTTPTVALRQWRQKQHQVQERLVHRLEQRHKVLLPTVAHLRVVQMVLLAAVHQQYLQMGTST
jgi:hypothetical protein